MENILLILLSLLIIYCFHTFKQIDSFLLSVFFTLTFFYGLFQVIGKYEFYVKVIWEGIVIFLFLYSISKNPSNSIVNFNNTLHFFLLFSFFFWASAFINNNNLYNVYLIYRFSLIPFILFLSLLNMNFSEYNFRKINTYLSFLFIVQIIASFFKALIIGQSEGVIVGSMSQSAGTLTTTFSLFAIGFLFAFYNLFKKKNVYILLAIGFLFFAWVGGKRAVWFYVPVLLSISFFLLTKISKMRFNLKFINIFLIILIFPTTIYIGGRLIPTLNPARKIGGPFDINYIINYVWEYNLDQKNGLPTQRLSGTLSVLRHFSAVGFDKIVFGYGPDYIEDYRRRSLGAYRGIWGRETGLNYSVVTLGAIGTLVILIYYLNFYFILFKITKTLRDPFWKAFAFGTLTATILFFIDFFTYSRSMFLNHVLAPTYFYCLSICCLNYRRQISITQHKTTPLNSASQKQLLLPL